MSTETHHVPGHVFFGWGTGWQPCPTCGGTQVIRKCAHGVHLGSYECAACIGPLSDAELDLVRRRLAGHEGCVPPCYRAPSSETARLLATIDAQREIKMGADRICAALASLAADYTIDCLPLPDGTSAEMSPPDKDRGHVAAVVADPMTETELNDFCASVAPILDRGALLAKPNAVLRSRGGESLGFDWIADIHGSMAEGQAYATLFANAPRLLATIDALRRA